MLRVLFKVVGMLLVIGSGLMAYQLSTTSFAAIPVIGALTVFFMVLMVIGSLIILLS